MLVFLIEAKWFGFEVEPRPRLQSHRLMGTLSMLATILEALWLDPLTILEHQATVQSEVFDAPTVSELTILCVWVFTRVDEELTEMRSLFLGGKKTAYTASGVSVELTLTLETKALNVGLLVSLIGRNVRAFHAVCRAQ